MSDTSTPGEITVSVSDETYTFKAPTCRQVAALGSRVQRLRAQDGDSSGDSLDEFAQSLYRASAIMELLLLRSSAEWPWSPGPDGKPILDSEQFPIGETSTLVEIQGAFYEQLVPMLGGPAA